jgi:hypothetical protein
VRLIGDVGKPLPALSSLLSNAADHRKHKLMSASCGGHGRIKHCNIHSGAGLIFLTNGVVMDDSSG